MTTRLKAPDGCSGFCHEGVTAEIVDGHIMLESWDAVEVAKNFGFVEVPADPVEPDPVEPDPVEPDPVEPDPVEPDPVEPDAFADMTVAQLKEWLDEYEISHTDAKNKADLLAVCRANVE